MLKEDVSNRPSDKELVQMIEDIQKWEGLIKGVVSREISATRLGLRGGTRIAFQRDAGIPVRIKNANMKIRLLVEGDVVYVEVDGEWVDLDTARNLQGKQEAGFIG